MPIVTVPPDETDQRKVVNMVRQMAEGRSNAHGAVTLTANAATTTVSNMNVGPSSVIKFMPTTANAAAALATTYVGTVIAGSFTITHANNAQVDRIFTYAVQG